VDGRCVRGGRGYHLHDRFFLRAGGGILLGLLKHKDSVGDPVGGGQLDIGYAPLPGLVPFFSLFLGGGSESIATGVYEESSFTHFYFNPAIGVLFYPDPKLGFSIGARFGFLDDEASQDKLNVSTTGYQVGGELGYGFWVGADLELSFRAVFGYFDISGSGSQTSSTSGGYSSSSASFSRNGPYGGAFVALTFN
jgi:hypothetical protein